MRCRLEIFEQRWHVFQLQAAQLRSARSAIDVAAAFAGEQIAATTATAAVAASADAEGRARAPEPDAAHAAG